MTQHLTARLRLTCLLSILLLCAACATNLTRSFSDSISTSILNQNDPATVRDGAPAYMLMLDGFIQENPNDAHTLRAAADLYGAYAMVFAKEPKRIQRLSVKSWTYARRALCLENRSACDQLDQPYAEFIKSLTALQAEQVPLLFSYAAAWINWIQAHADDWHARADIPKVTALLQRLTELQPEYQWGRAYLYLGVLNSQLPSAMGGEPERARSYFENAIRISAGQDLIAKVYYARYYARLLFEQELHDRLLNEVIEAKPEYPDLTLSNVIAKEQARTLLAETEDYFGE